MAVIFVDYKNGVDTNDGSSGSPLKTLAHTLASHAANGDTILLRGTSATDEIHRANGVSTALSDLTMAADIGHFPVVSASLAYSSWSLTAEQSFTYETTYTPNGCYMVWNGTVFFTSKASIAEVEAEENTFYFDNTGNKLHVHIAGGGMPGTLEAGAGNGAMTFSGANATVRGITFEHDLAGISLSGTNPLVQKCTFQYAYHPATSSTAGISTSNSGAVIEDCTIISRYGKGLYLSTGSSNVRIRRCTLISLITTSSVAGNNGVEIKVGTGHEIERCFFTNWVDGVYAMNGTSSTVRHNTFVDCYHAFCLWENNAPCVAHHNICYLTKDSGDFPTHGFVLHNQTSPSQCYHNTFAYLTKNSGATPHGCGFHIDNGATAATTYASNNSFYGCKIGIYWDVTSAANTFYLGNNAFFDCTNNFVGVPSEDQGTGNVTTDPMFVNPGNYDFRLLPSSPLIDAGLAVTGINEGFRGGAPDIGAHEYVRPLRHGRR